MRKSPLALLLTGLFLTACSDENLEKCQTLMLDEGMQSLARPYCETAAIKGNREAQQLFATLLLEEKETKQAVEFLEKSANQGNGQAMFQLGELYLSGNDTLEKNLDTALFYFEKSCENNEIKGCERARNLTKQKASDEQAKALALEKARAATLEKERAKLEAEAKAEEQKRLSEIARQEKAEADALKEKNVEIVIEQKRSW